MTIRSIHISNFQSHKKTVVHFEDGVNVIIGPSDSGKTAVIRALNWVINNRPAGDSFMSKWGGDTKVAVVLDDGTSIVRFKSKTENSYTIDWIEGSQEFKAFGQDVPAEVKELFNMNELNIQFQMDSPFLLSNGSGEVAQILNKAVNLDVIDRAVSNIRKKKLETDKELKFNESRLLELDKQISSFQYIENMEVDVALMEQLENSIVYSTTRKGSLKGLISRSQEGERKLSEISAILQAESVLQSIFVKNSCLDSLKDRKRLLEDISTRILDIVDEDNKYYDILSAKDTVDSLIVLNDKKSGIVKMSSLLTNLTSVMKSKEEELLSLQDRIHELQTEFTEMMPDECPLCGR